MNTTEAKRAEYRAQGIVLDLLEDVDELQAEVERLREALEPFARFATMLPPTQRDSEDITWMGSIIKSGPTIGDCRRAAEALAGVPLTLQQRAEADKLANGPCMSADDACPCPQCEAGRVEAGGE